MPFNINPKKNTMQTPAPEVRRHNFDEVAIGYTEELTIDEEKR